MEINWFQTALYKRILNYRDCLRRRTPCPECGEEVTDGSLTAHGRKMNGTKPEIDWYCLLVIQIEHHTMVYQVRLPDTLAT